MYRACHIKFLRRTRRTDADIAGGVDGHAVGVSRPERKRRCSGRPQEEPAAGNQVQVTARGAVRERQRRTAISVGSSQRTAGRGLHGEQAAGARCANPNSSGPIDRHSIRIRCGERQRNG